MTPDLYSVLGVTSDSDEVVIQAAYRALMRKYHPDKNTSEGAEARAAEINRAYEILGDPDRRARYDASRSSSGSQSGSPQSRNREAGASKSHNLMDLPAHRLTPIERRWIYGITIAGLLVLLIYVQRSQATNDERTKSDNVEMPTDGTFTERAPTSSNPSSQPLLASASAAAPPNGLPTPSQISRKAEPNFDDIEEAAHQFDRVLAKSGIVGARRFSEKCHSDLKTSPSWSAADRCVAFDLAANYIDTGMTQITGGGVQKDQYFSFVSDNASDTYEPFGAPPFTSGERVEKIRNAVQPIIVQIVEGRDAKLANQPARGSKIGQ